MEKLDIQPTYENIYTILDLLSKEENLEFSDKLCAKNYTITAIYIYLSSPKKLSIELVSCSAQTNYETVFREEQYNALTQFFD